MDPIEIHLNPDNVGKQLQFLIDLELATTWARAKKLLYYFIGFNVFGLIVILLPDTDTNIPFKGVFAVMIPLAWLTALIMAWRVIAVYKSRTKWKKGQVRLVTPDNNKYWLSFNDQSISYSTNKYSVSQNWDCFEFYLIKNDACYLFRSMNPYETLIIQKPEIYHDHYNRLIDLVEHHLKPYSKGNGT